MKKVEIRPATRDELMRELGAVNFTVRAIIAEDGGQFLGLGGLVFIRGQVIGFCELTPEALRRPVTLFKVARAFLLEAGRSGHRHIFSLPEPGKIRARPWLERLGFQDIGNGVMRWQQPPG